VRMTRVLVADDNPAFRSLCAELLEGQGLQVVGEAADAATAMRLARSLAPDMVVLDVHLGRHDGWEVARRLRALDRAPRVVMVSSDAGAGDPALVAHVGADRFVPKEELGALDLVTPLGGPATAR
jgi:two-component system, NarL family, nitrate/nitrite response regulator NarL